MSSITRHARRCKLLWGLIRAVLLVGPIVGAFIYALTCGQIKTENTIVFGVIFAFIMLVCIINIICRFHLRFPGWLFIFFCMWLVKSVYVIIIIIGVCTILDEIIATPFYRHYKQQYKFNKAYDERQELDKRYNYIKEHENDTVDETEE